jgi:uncharacterized protein YdbL (DUF1318 family)
MNKILFLLLIFSCREIPIKLNFTNEPTALEKQIIGEDKELEKDGWLISSIKTSSIGLEELNKESSYYNEIGLNDKSYQEVLDIIFYLAPKIKFYKSRNILGEGLDGLLHIINKNEASNEFKTEESKNQIHKTVRLINDARVRIYETYLIKNSKNNNKQENKNVFHLFYDQAEIGDYIEISKGKWVKK